MEAECGWGLASFPGPCPASRCLQYGKAGEGLVHFLTWVMSQTGQIMQTWVSCKPLYPHAHTGARLFRVERWQRTKKLLCCSSRDSQEDREFYQSKTVKTHSSNLVVLTHIQLKSFYRLSIRDVTHMRKHTRPSPALPYCKRREAGRGPGNEASWGLFFLICSFIQ